MRDLTTLECIQIGGGEEAQLSTAEHVGQIVGGIGGALLAIPFWLGAILFGASGDAHGRESSHFMMKLGEATTWIGSYLGEKIGGMWIYTGSP